MLARVVQPGSTYGFDRFAADRLPDTTAGRWTTWYKRVTPEVERVFSRKVCTFEHRYAKHWSVLLLYHPLPLAAAPALVLKDYAQETPSGMKVSTAGDVPAEALHEELRQTEARWKEVRGTVRKEMIGFLEERAFGSYPNRHDLYIMARRGEWFSWYDFDLLLRLEWLMRTGGTRKDEKKEGRFYFCYWPEMRQGWSPPTEMRLPSGQLFGGPLEAEHDPRSRKQIIHPVHDILYQAYQTGSVADYREKGYAPQNLRVAALEDFEFLGRGEEPDFLPATEKELFRVFGQPAQ